MKANIDNLKGKLIVSCQALENEPLHSSFIMGRMARAAFEGGASGIRANSVIDIAEIKKTVVLPIIGIIKRDYDYSAVFITATMTEIDALAAAGCDIIALDATKRLRPGQISLDDFYREVRAKYPEQLLMADCSTVEEALHADELGFDFVGTTLFGYTDYSRVDSEVHYLSMIREIVAKVKAKVIAEGNISSPAMAREVLDLGCFAVVVGSAITRPQLITKKYADAISGTESGVN